MSVDLRKRQSGVKRHDEEFFTPPEPIQPRRKLPHEVMEPFIQSNKRRRRKQRTRSILPTVMSTCMGLGTIVLIVLLLLNVISLTPLLLAFMVAPFAVAGIRRSGESKFRKY